MSSSAPAALRLRCLPRRGARAPHQRDCPASGSGSGRERPSPRIGSRRMPRCTLALVPAEASPPAPTRVPARVERERRIVRSRRTLPERDAHGHATRFAPHKTLSRRPSAADVATDGSPMRSWDGDHSRGSVKRWSPARRRSASGGDVSTGCGPARRASPLAPHPKARRDRIRPCRPLGPGLHPETRTQLALPSCVEMSPSPRRPRDRVAHRLARRLEPQPAVAALRPPSPSQPPASGWCPESTLRWPPDP
jgi:hypothetical protein